MLRSPDTWRLTSPVLLSLDSFRSLRPEAEELEGVVCVLQSHSQPLDLDLSNLCAVVITTR